MTCCACQLASTHNLSFVLFLGKLCVDIQMGGRDSAANECAGDVRVVPSAQQACTV